MDLSKLSGKVPQRVLDQIPGVMEKFQINTPLRLAHFLSQAGHESGGFKISQENLNYSVKGLVNIFKKYFPSEGIAADYAKKPEKIANRVYSGRMGNGNEASGDGYKYRGRGDLQLTGKDNYVAFFKAIGLDPNSDPNLVATTYQLLSAAWFWSKNNLNKIADTGATDAAVTMITKRVNGGVIGLDARKKEFQTFYSLLA